MENILRDQFVELLESHQNIVHKVCRIYARDKASHDDLFQEITIQLWQAYPKFRGDSKFSTWMYRVALNTAITSYRKEKGQRHQLDIDDFPNALKAEPYDNTMDRQMEALYGAIDQLNDIDKALVLLYVEDKNYQEISETLGISEVNARVKMNRIKTKLKTLINT